MPNFADYANFGQEFGYTGNELGIAYEKQTFLWLSSCISQSGTEVLSLEHHSYTSGSQSAFPWPAVKSKSTAKGTQAPKANLLERQRSKQRQTRWQRTSRRSPSEKPH